MKIYISGPMTGIEDLNRPAFDRAADILRDMGHEPIIPGDLHPKNTPYGEALKNALRAMLECDRIVMLSGWGNSRGARLEYQIAEAIEMEQMYL